MVAENLYIWRSSAFIPVRHLPNRLFKDSVKSKQIHWLNQLVANAVTEFAMILKSKTPVRAPRIVVEACRMKIQGSIIF